MRALFILITNISSLVYVPLYHYTYLNIQQSLQSSNHAIRYHFSVEIIHTLDMHYQLSSELFS